MGQNTGSLIQKGRWCLYRTASRDYTQSTHQLVNSVLEVGSLLHCTKSSDYTFAYTLPHTVCTHVSNMLSVSL